MSEVRNRWQTILKFHNQHKKNNELQWSVGLKIMWDHLMNQFITNSMKNSQDLDPINIASALSEQDKPDTVRSSQILSDFFMYVL